MAHECPECYQVCYCGGDIDDAEMNGTEAQSNCSHCLGREDEEDEEELNPKRYFNRGRTLDCGEDIPAEKSAALDKGEVFTLLNRSGKPYILIMKDSYGTIREGPLEPSELSKKLIPIEDRRDERKGGSDGKELQ